MKYLVMLVTLGLFQLSAIAGEFNQQGINQEIQKMQEAMAKVQREFKADIEDKVASFPQLEENLTAFSAQVQSASENYQQLLQDISKMIAVQVGKELSELKALEKLKETNNSRAIKRLIEEKKDRIKKKFEMLKVQMRGSYNNAFNQVYGLEGNLLVPVLQSARKIRRERRRAKRKAWFKLAGRSAFLYGLLGIPSAIIFPTFVGTLIDIQLWGDNNMTDYRPGPLRKMHNKLQTDWDRYKEIGPAGNYVVSYQFRSPQLEQVFERKKNAKQFYEKLGKEKLFRTCKTAGCVFLMNELYRDWVKNISKLNKDMKVGPVKLHKSEVASVRKVRKSLDHFSEVIAKELPVAQF